MSAWLARLRAGLREHEVTREDNSTRGEAESRERFTLVREIGRGGMGAVFEAQDNELGRRVALKFLRARGLSSLQRFQVESRTLARLQHPNVVSVHEVGELDGGVFLVMDFVDGESIDHLVGRGPLDPREAVRIAREVALALEHCHSHDVLHRDVKPGNVLLAKDGRVLLTDFGVAKELDSSRDLTQTGGMVGTPAYMAPEQALGRREAVDARSDVFALGATLFEMLVGAPPLAELNLPLRILDGTPEAPSKKRPELDADLDAICLKCLQPDSGLRYSSALALREDLDRYLDGQSVLARQPAGPGLGFLLASLLGVLFLVGLVILLLLPAKKQVGASLTPSLAVAASPAPSAGFAPLARHPLKLELPDLAGGGFAGPELAFGYGVSEWRVWRLSDRSVVATDRRDDPIRHASSSRDGKRLVVARIGAAQVFALPSGELLAEFKLGAELSACAPQTGEVALAVDRVLLRWSGGQPEKLADCGSEPRSLRYAPNGELLALSAGSTNRDEGTPRELLIWDTRSGKVKHRWELARPAFRLAFSADSRLLAAGDDWGAVRVLDLAHPEAPPLELKDEHLTKGLSLGGAHSGPISGLTFGTGSDLYSASGHSPERARTLVNELRLWRVHPQTATSRGRVEVGNVRARLEDEVLILDRAPGRALLLRGLRAAGRLEVRRERSR